MNFFLSLILFAFMMIKIKAQYNFSYPQVVSLMNFKKSKDIITKFKLLPKSKEQNHSVFIVKINNIDYKMVISTEKNDELYGINLTSSIEGLSADDYKILYKNIYNNLLKCGFAKEHYNTYYYKNEEYDLDLNMISEHPNDNYSRFSSVFFLGNSTAKQFWLDLKNINELEIKISYSLY